ncbi:MAG: ribose-phosphate pyrophosphokinase [Phycisphaerales bacterium]|nr:ribose-phosphate pyrophosphokinase [Phycisphaerales bacterium]
MTMDGNNELRVFAGRNSRVLAEQVCAHMGIAIGEARTDVFPDGELLVRLEEDVRGRDCYVIISTCSPVNDNLVELLIFIDCLKRASARRVTIVTPYFGYGRQDRKDKGRVPITAKLVANLITAARADRVLALDLHAAQIQGFFDLPVDHLSATPVFLDYFQSIRDRLGDLCMVSPDVGNVKVAEGFANLLGGDLAIINKRRVSGTEVVTEHIIGSVRGKTVLMFDDMISTGGTICEAAKLVMEHGAVDVIAAATHGVLCGRAIEKLQASPISSVVITNTIPIDGRLDPLGDRLQVLCVGELLGEAVHRIHNNLSLSALFERTAGTKR